MKGRKSVLMFGWEFPPHISGGLGTACLGLTQALTNHKVKVTFVVPKLFGNEPADRLKLISASSVRVPTGEDINEEKVVPKSSIVTRKNVKTLHRRNRNLKIETIEVPSVLSPYTSSVTTTGTTTLENWNYEIEKKYTETKVIKRFNKVIEVTKPVTKSYTFTGGYGPDLLNEVIRYSEVGEQIAKTRSFDVIHAHDWMTFEAGIRAKQASGKPLIIHVHATEVDRGGTNVNSVIYAQEKAGMDAADKIITVSEWTKNIVIQKYNIDESKIEVVHNGILPRTKTVSTSSTPFGSHLVTFLGRVTYQKGPQYFIEAARKVSAQFPEAHFVMAGAGDLLPQMIERVAQLKLSSRFHFTGFLQGDSVDKIWEMSNVYVMPSVSEPFGIAPLEAVQSGVPVILSNQSGVAEVIDHAIKVDFWNTEALANAICSVLKYNSLYSTLKQNSGNEIKNITWDKAAQKINRIYHEITKANHA